MYHGTLQFTTVDIVALRGRRRGHPKGCPPKHPHVIVVIVNQMSCGRWPKHSMSWQLVQRGFFRAM